MRRLPGLLLLVVVTSTVVFYFVSAERRSTKSASTPTASVDLVETRATWRQRLQWSNECEEAFSATQSGSQGIEIDALGNNTILVSVLCAAGSYQPAFEFFLYDQTHHNATPLRFETYRSADGQRLEKFYATELWGEVHLDSPSRQMTVLSIARQSADCGTWAQYLISPGGANLQEFRARLPCPTEFTEDSHVSRTSPQAWPLVFAHKN